MLLVFECLGFDSFPDKQHKKTVYKCAATDTYLAMEFNEFNLEMPEL